MNKWVEIILGLIFLNAAILVWIYSSQWGAFWNFGAAAWEFLKGGLIWIIILIGFLFIMLGVSDLKE